MSEKRVVGSKGELFPPKKVREKAGFKPGDEIIFEASEGVIVVKKRISLREALRLPKYVEMAPEEWERESREENKKHFEKFDEDLHPNAKNPP